MNKIRTLNQAQDFLDNEFSWRLKEIAELNTSIRSSKNPRQKILIRAGITMLYAHWEGFIKNSTEAYVNYVSNQKEQYRDLDFCFIIHGLKSEIHSLSETNKYSINNRVVEFLMDEIENTSSIPFRNSVNTQSNLSSKLFQEIALSVGIDLSLYETRFHFLDESILERRNKIAHGEYLDVDEKSYNDLNKGIIRLMRQYKTDIENSIVLKSFIR